MGGIEQSLAPPNFHRRHPRAIAAEVVGVEIPIMESVYLNANPPCDWSCMAQNYFGPAIMKDIKNNLGATYVRTGWIPALRSTDWSEEDTVMDNACNAGLKVMVIVPGAPDANNPANLPSAVDNFFSRYTQREKGCYFWAEVVNEANISDNGYSGSATYATYYESVAPIIGSYSCNGCSSPIPVITSGVTQCPNPDETAKPVPWTEALANYLTYNSAPVTGFGFHPYCVAPDQMASAFYSLRNAAVSGGWNYAPPIYGTEYGSSTGSDLYTAIVDLQWITNTFTVYEYKATPGEATGTAQDALVKATGEQNTARYTAVQNAITYIKQHP